MKVNLILPRMEDDIDVLAASSLVSEIFSRILGWGRTGHTPPLSLLMLAAVTPPDIEIKIIDDRLEGINFEEPVDLVGISVVTRSAQRAYQVASEYRKRGVKVVLGGIHPTALPEEASQYADSVVLGEGEHVWPALLNDFIRGQLKPKYRGRPEMNLDSLPFARRELIRRPDLYATTKVLSATRGCPNTCTFCAAGTGLVKTYRKRSVKNVIQELETVAGNVALFMDDNIAWEPEYAKDLFRAMIPLKLKWHGGLSVNALEDEELVKLAAESGCFMLGIGFESISPKVISSIRKEKTNHPGRYAELIKRAQQAGMVVFGGFIVGFDEDDLLVFDQLIDFINASRLDIASVYLLTPYPGSPLYRKYERENRILHKEWRYYEAVEGTCVYIPKQMSPVELMNNYVEVVERLFPYPSILKRAIQSKAFPCFGTLASLHLNFENHHAIKELKKQVRGYKDFLTTQGLLAIEGDADTGTTLLQVASDK